ncbi:MAG: hypothetical protein P8L42_05155, partial [Flavicella sp.]|nr:hypothetical protein [Flavicella sp.]
MKKLTILFSIIFCVICFSCSQKEEDLNFEKEIVSENPVQPDDFMNPPDSGNEWSTIKIPANPGDENVWELQEEVSDDFNYTFESVSSAATIEGKWKN